MGAGAADAEAAGAAGAGAGDAAGAGAAAAAGAGADGQHPSRFWRQLLQRQLCNHAAVNCQRKHGATAREGRTKTRQQQTWCDVVRCGVPW